MGAGLPHKTIAGPISSAQMKAVSRGTSSPSIHQSRLKPPENCDFVWCFLEKRAPVPYLATGTSRCLVGPPRQPHCNPILSAHIIAGSCGGCPTNKNVPVGSRHKVRIRSGRPPNRGAGPLHAAREPSSRETSSRSRSVSMACRRQLSS